MNWSVPDFEPVAEKLDAPTTVSGRQPRWRGVLSAFLIVLAGLLTPVAMISGWARATLTDTDAFVATYGPVIRDPSVRTYLTDQVVAAIDGRIGIEGLVGDAVDGLAGALGNRPRLTSALQLLQRPAVEGLRSMIVRVTGEVVAAEGFARAWEQSLRTSHIQVTGALAGDPRATLTFAEAGVGLQLGPMIDRVRTALLDRGFRLAARIPAVDRTIVLWPHLRLADLKPGTGWPSDWAPGCPG